MVQFLSIIVKDKSIESDNIRSCKKRFLFRWVIDPLGSRVVHRQKQQIYTIYLA